MRLDENPVWNQDLDMVMRVLPELSELSGKTVMLTGAAGLICSAVTDLLFRYNETHDEPIHVLAAGRRMEKMAHRFGAYCKKPYFHFIQYDATKGDNHLTIPCDYIIHGANNASPDIIVREPVETMCGNFTGLLELLQYGSRCGAKRVLYISSSEVYGKRENREPYREEECGYIDILNPRNSYAMGKHAAETLCASYTAEYGLETVIVRPGHIYGPTASPNDTRISSAWAYAAARGEDIVMKSVGSQIRSYCHCLDCATAILKVLLRGESAHAYNISNPDSIISIKELAELLAKVGRVQLIQANASEMERKRFNPMQNSLLDSTRLEALGWHGCFDSARGLARTVEILRALL